MHIYVDLGLPGCLIVKNLPAMQETQVQSLGSEFPIPGSNPPLPWIGILTLHFSGTLTWSFES